MYTYIRYIIYILYKNKINIHLFGCFLMKLVYRAREVWHYLNKLLIKFMP